MSHGLPATARRAGRDAPTPGNLVVSVENGLGVERACSAGAAFPGDGAAGAASLPGERADGRAFFEAVAPVVTRGGAPPGGARGAPRRRRPRAAPESRPFAEERQLLPRIRQPRWRLRPGRRLRAPAGPPRRTARGARAPPRDRRGGPARGRPAAPDADAVAKRSPWPWPSPRRRPARQRRPRGAAGAGTLPSAPAAGRRVAATSPVRSPRAASQATRAAGLEGGTPRHARGGLASAAGGAAAPGRAPSASVPGRRVAVAGDRRRRALAFRREAARDGRCAVVPERRQRESLVAPP